MIPAARHHEILEQLRTRGAASIADLAALTGSSEVTIRRDLLALDQQGLIDRRRGGAVLRTATARFPGQVTNDRDEASALAHLTAKLVDDGETIALGAGPVIAQLAACLSTKSGLTVITNSLLVGEALAGSEVETVVVGGSLRGASMAVVGSETERIVTALGAPRVFLAGDGLTHTWGLSGADAALVNVGRAMVDAADELVVVAETAIVGKDALALTAGCARIAQVVTTDRANYDVVAGLQDAGVHVHTVPDAARNVA